jgi:hypothetical protein
MTESGTGGENVRGKRNRDRNRNRNRKARTYSLAPRITIVVAFVITEPRT